MAKTCDFKYGDKVTDLSGIEGTVIPNPFGKRGLIRVAFGEDGKSNWRDLNPKHLNKKMKTGLDRYPEFEYVVNAVVDKTMEMVNRLAPIVESEMPYKPQFVLEEVIKKLQSLV